MRIDVFESYALIGIEGFEPELSPDRFERQFGRALVKQTQHKASEDPHRAKITRKVGGSKWKSKTASRSFGGAGHSLKK